MILLRSVFLCALLSVCPVLRGQQSPATQVKAIVRSSKLQGVQIGVLVADVASGSIVVRHNADVALIPASNTKLVTTAAGLEQLGTGYKFATKLYLRGTLSDGLLDGDLLLVGGADPSFSGRFYDGDSTKVLRQWVAALHRLGLRKINGNLLLDVSATSGPAIHPEWPQDQLNRWYCAPVGALNLNDNCVDVRVSAGKVGQPVRYSMGPEIPYYRVLNKMLTVSRGRKHAPWLHRPEGDSRLELRGTFQGGRPAQVITITVPDPARFLGQVFKGLLAKSGIQLSGKLQLSESPVTKPGRLIAVHTCPIDQVVTVINKRSQNLFAECLFRALGRKAGHPGSFVGGRKAVESYLSKVGVEGARVADGSGLARGNRYSPRAMVAILRRMWSHAGRKTFFDSLSVAGTDGTLKRRMRSGPAKGQVHAKTGYIKSVSALSGYLKTRGGRWLAFSLIFNGFQRKGKQLSNSTIKGYQDRICQALAGGR